MITSQQETFLEEYLFVCIADESVDEIRKITMKSQG